MTRDHKLNILLLIALTGAAGGCAAGRFDGPLQDLVRRDLSVDEREYQYLQSATSEDGKFRDQQESDINDLKTVDDMVHLALARNPVIRAAEQKVLRMRERIDQVTSLDDPRLKVVPIGSMAETAAGQVYAMTSISQKFPFPGKLDTKGKIARQDVAIAEQELAAARLKVAADIRDAYWNYYYTVQAVDITRQNKELLLQLRDVAQSRYRAGQANQQSVLRASVEINNIDKNLIELEQRKNTFVARLNSLMNRSVNADIPVPPGADLDGVNLKADEILQLARENNPDVKMLQEVLEKYHSSRKLAGLSRKPDITVSASYNLVHDYGLAPMANGDDQWWIGFSINIPIWEDKLDAAEREASRGILETASRIADEKNRVGFLVSDAMLRINSEFDQAKLLRDVIIPQAVQTVEASLSGYRSGDVDFLTLIDNWRKLLAFQLMFQRSMTDMQQALADLQEVVGGDLEGGNNNTETEND